MLDILHAAIECLYQTPIVTDLVGRQATCEGFSKNCVNIEQYMYMSLFMFYNRRYIIVKYVYHTL